MRRALLAAALVGCSVPATDVHPRALEVAGDVGGLWCAHLAACFPSHYAARFPSDADAGDVAACVAAGSAGIPADRLDTCDASRVAQCRADIRAAACADRPADESMPASCEGC